MAKVKVPPPDPAFGRAQEAASRTAQAAETRAAENDRFYKEVLLPRYLDQMDEQISLGREESGRQQMMADYALGRAKKYDGLQDEWIQQVNAFDTEAERERRAGMALTDVKRGLADQRGQSMRSLARMGLNPNSGRFAQVFADQETSAALAQAGAATMAREAARREGMQMRAGAAGMGAGYLGQAGAFGMNSIGALGSGMGALQGMQGAQGANAGQWTAMSGFGMGVLGDAANRGFQQQQLGFQANQANASAINGMLGSAMGMATSFGTAGIMKSDRRLKKNIQRVATRADGLGVYSYDYVWGGPRQVGVMADEVRKVYPNAVIRGADGYDMVDYSKLGG